MKPTWKKTYSGPGYPILPKPPEEIFSCIMKSPVRYILHDDGRSEIEEVRCPRCHHEIDPTTCWCGDLIKGASHEGHQVVPMGCTCHYSKPTDLENPPDLS